MKPGKPQPYAYLAQLGAHGLRYDRQARSRGPKQIADRVMKTCYHASVAGG